MRTPDSVRKKRRRRQNGNLPAGGPELLRVLLDRIRDEDASDQALLDAFHRILREDAVRGEYVDRLRSGRSCGFRILDHRSAGVDHVIHEHDRFVCDIAEYFDGSVLDFARGRPPFREDHDVIVLGNAEFLEKRRILLRARNTTPVRRGDDKLLSPQKPCQILRRDWRPEQVVMNGLVEERHALLGVDIEHDDPIRMRDLEHLDRDLYADRLSRRILAIGPIVAEFRDDIGHSSRRRQARGIRKKDGLHEIVRLPMDIRHDEDVESPDILVNLDLDFSVIEAPDVCLPEGQTKERADFFCERLSGVRPEDTYGSIAAISCHLTSPHVWYAPRRGERYAREKNTHACRYLTLSRFFVKTNPRPPP